MHALPTETETKEILPSITDLGVIYYAALDNEYIPLCIWKRTEKFLQDNRTEKGETSNVSIYSQIQDLLHLPGIQFAFFSKILIGIWGSSCSDQTFTIKLLFIFSI